MALVNLTTNLKSLRYGKDTIGGGNSNQPYVKTSIPEDLSDVGRTGGPDFLLRGGTLLPKIVVNDVSRMTKMFFDFKSPRGPLFIAKQNLLSLTNVSSQVGYVVAKEDAVVTPFSEGTAIGNLLRSLLPPLNQGIYTPLSTIGQAAGNAIGLHLDKQGLGFNFKTTVGSPDGNSLLGLPTYLNTIHTNATDGPKSRLYGLLDKINTNTQGVNDLYSYSGGPGAILGVGKTNIVMVGDQRTGINNPTLKLQNNRFIPQQQVENSKIFLGKDGFNNPPYSLSFLAPQLKYNFFPPEIAATLFREDYIDFRPDSVYQSGTLLKTDTDKLKSGISNETPQLQLSQEQIEGKNPVSKGGEIENFSEPFVGPYVPSSLDYTLGGGKNRIEQRVNLGDPGKKANRRSYTIGLIDLGTSDPTVSDNSTYTHALDKINAFPLYRSDKVTSDNTKNDLVKFRIGVISNEDPNLKTYIHFRAFIDSFADNYSADWGSQSYMGRGEKFYKYKGFDRQISMAWTVAAQSKQELIPMYQKLNYLASVCAPDYSSNGYMQGNLITLTVGGYFQEQVGIMTGINFDIPQESPWEISIPDQWMENRTFVPGTSKKVKKFAGEGAHQFSWEVDEGIEGKEILTDPSVKELPMIIKVSGFNFIPIHNFVPRVQQNKFTSTSPADKIGTGFIGEYGKEHYINLAAGSGNNYGKEGKPGKDLNYIPKSS